MISSLFYFFKLLKKFKDLKKIKMFYMYTYITINKLTLKYRNLFRDIKFI